MKIMETSLEGVVLIKPTIYEDNRGFFKETFEVERYRQVGINLPFVQDNFSHSRRGVLRGLHYQIKRPQGKLVSCSKGAVFDVVVDVDPTSLSFGAYYAVELTERNHLQLWIPPGYAHGFCVVSEIADVQYKCTEFYDPSSESGVLWCDQEIGISWPITAPLVSEKDGKLPSLRHLETKSL